MSFARFSLVRNSLFRWLCISLLALMVPAAVNAQSAAFATAGLFSLFVQESQCEGKQQKETDVNFNIEISLPGLLCPGCPALLQECLKAWKECWQKGDYEAARHHASKAILLDPKCPQAQRAHELTNKLKLSRFDFSVTPCMVWSS